MKFQRRSAEASGVIQEAVKEVGETLKVENEKIKRAATFEIFSIYGTNSKVQNFKKIWLSSPHMGVNEFEFVRDAFESNWIAPVGPHLVEFENTLCDYMRVRYLAAVVSGTAAIHLALLLLNVECGDEVICQSLTFSGSANPIRYQNAIPIFVDSEESTWNLCPGFLEEAIKSRIEKGKRPKALIAVHLYGMPTKITEILEVCNRYDIPLIEDAAEALGSRYFDQPVGGFGQIGILSFNGNKIITTSGGGAILSDHEKLIAKARFLATQARDPAPHYQHSEIGYNYRMSNVLAGIGRGQMMVLDERVVPKLSDFMRRSIGIFWPSDAWANAASIKWIHFTFAQAPENQDLLKSHPQQSLNLGSTKACQL